MKLQDIFLTFFLIICALEHEYNLDREHFDLFELDGNDTFSNINIGLGQLSRNYHAFKENDEFIETRQLTRKSSRQS